MYSEQNTAYFQFMEVVVAFKIEPLTGPMGALVWGLDTSRATQFRRISNYRKSNAQPYRHCHT